MPNKISLPYSVSNTLKLNSYSYDNRFKIYTTNSDINYNKINNIVFL